MAVLYRTEQSDPFADFRRCALELLVEARTTQVVKTRQSLGIFRNVATFDALETAKSTSGNLIEYLNYYWKNQPVLVSRHLDSLKSLYKFKFKKI